MSCFSPAVAGAEFGEKYIYIIFLFTKLFFFCCRCKCCSFVSTFCSLRCRLSGQTAGAAGERNKRVRGREIKSKPPHQFTRKSSLAVSPLLTLLTQRLYMSVKPPHVLMNQSPAKTSRFHVFAVILDFGVLCFLFCCYLIHKKKIELLSAG